MVTGADVPPFGLRTTTVCVEGETKISRTLKLPGVLFAFFVTTHKSPFASSVNVWVPSTIKTAPATTFEPVAVNRSPFFLN